MPGGQFRLWFNAGGSSPYVIEATADLESWTPVSTNTPLAGRVDYIETDMGPPWQFYRARRAQ
jgi:hypothetical protein